MEKKTIVPRGRGDHTESASEQNVARFHYRVVYSNGLNEPVETLLGASEALQVDNENVREALCKFVQSSIDMDCRRVLFAYQEFPSETSE